MSGKQYSVAYAPEARDDLDEIYSYIAFSLQERQVAKNLTERIRKEIRAIPPFIESYPIVDFEPWKNMGIRRMTVKNFNVYYYADKDERIVTVLRIFYGGRDVEHIAAENED